MDTKTVSVLPGAVEAIDLIDEANALDSNAENYMSLLDSLSLKIHVFLDSAVTNPAASRLKLLVDTEYLALASDQADQIENPVFKVAL